MIPSRCECGAYATNRIVLRVHACYTGRTHNSPVQIVWRTPGSRHWQRVDIYDACPRCTRAFREIYAGLAGSQLEVYLLNKEQIA